MTIEYIPRLAMTHTSAFVCGFILAVWCNGPSQPNLPRETWGPGFRIIFSTRTSPDRNSKQDSQNETVTILRRDESNPHKLCKLSDDGLSAQLKGRYVSISGTLKNLEEIAPFMRGVRLRDLEFKRTTDVMDFQPCGTNPAIFYGTH